MLASRSCRAGLPQLRAARAGEALPVLQHNLSRPREHSFVEDRRRAAAEGREHLRVSCELGHHTGNRTEGSNPSLSAKKKTMQARMDHVVLWVTDPALSGHSPLNLRGRRMA